MKIKSVIIFGSNGMLGRYISLYLIQKGYHVTCITRQELDVVSDFDHLLTKLDAIHMDENTLVINCVGLIPQTSNMNELDYIKINSIFPVQLASICKKYNAKMIHPTTDCVFNGTVGTVGNYNENSLKDETNMYGISKILGENAPVTVIRTSIIGEERFHKRSLLEWAKLNKGKTIQGYTHHFWNGVTCLEFAKIVVYMIECNLFWTGIRHLFSPNSVSKYHLLHMINDTFKLGLTIEPMNTKKVDKTLSSEYPDTLCDYKIPTLEQQLLELTRFNIN